MVWPVDTSDTCVVLRLEVSLSEHRWDLPELPPSSSQSATSLSLAPLAVLWFSGSSVDNGSASSLTDPLRLSLSEGTVVAALNCPVLGESLGFEASP